MSWLSNATGIHWNLRPLAAPAGAIVGGMIGGPLGAGIGAGLMKSSDNLAHGDSFGHALGQGALNGALAYGAGSLFGGGASNPSALDDPAAAAQGLPIQLTGDGTTPSVSYLPQAAGSVRDQVMKRVMGGLGSVGHDIGSAASWINNNGATVDALGNVAGGIAKLSDMNAQNRIAQENADANNAYIQSQINLQKQRQAAFAALFAKPISQYQTGGGAYGGGSYG